MITAAAAVMHMCQRKKVVPTARCRGARGRVEEDLDPGDVRQSAVVHSIQQFVR